MVNKENLKYAALGKHTDIGKDGFENKVFPVTPAVPYDPSVGLYTAHFPRYAQPYEFEGWQKETMSWKESCYICAALLHNPTTQLHGPDVIELLADCTINSHSNFPIGKIKHIAITNDDGNVLSHGMTMRVGEEEVWTYSLTPYLNYMMEKRAKELGKTYRVEFIDRTAKEYNFQVGGPRILEVLEKATGEDLHDIGFLCHRTSTIAGKPVRIMRFGMGGTLAYEVHGDMADARIVYSKIYEVGREFEMQRIGWLTYSCQHPENGFPQAMYTFMTAAVIDPEYVEYCKNLGFDMKQRPFGSKLTGSSGQEPAKRVRNPIENNWNNSINWDHDFPGKAILNELYNNPKRKTVTLIWNTEDLVDVFKSLFQKGEPIYRFLDFPIEPLSRFIGGGSVLHQDDVYDKNGKLIGASSARTYTLHQRVMFSHGTIDIDYTELGTEVYVLWGEPGERQKKIRATVAKFPILDMALNKDFDVENIPYLK